MCACVQTWVYVIYVFEHFLEEIDKMEEMGYARDRAVEALRKAGMPCNNRIQRAIALLEDIDDIPPGQVDNDSISFFCSYAGAYEKL